MTAIILAGLGAACLIVAGFISDPAVGLGITGVLLLLVGLFAEFGDET